MFPSYDLRRSIPRSIKSFGRGSQAELGEDTEVSLCGFPGLRVVRSRELAHVGLWGTSRIGRDSRSQRPLRINLLKTAPAAKTRGVRTGRVCRVR